MILVTLSTPFFWWLLQSMTMGYCAKKYKNRSYGKHKSKYLSTKLQHAIWRKIQLRNSIGVEILQTTSKINQRNMQSILVSFEIAQYVNICTHYRQRSNNLKWHDINFQNKPHGYPLTSRLLLHHLIYVIVLKRATQWLLKGEQFCEAMASCKTNGSQWVIAWTNMSIRREERASKSSCIVYVLVLLISRINNGSLQVQEQYLKGRLTNKKSSASPGL